MVDVTMGHASDMCLFDISNFEGTDRVIVEPWIKEDLLTALCLKEK
jgi:hypothetical protein